MHACGHDLHTTMLLGAARILKEYEDEIEGTIKLMFQPAEEIFEGAHDMIMAGVLENPTVDAGMMMHVTAGMPFPAGTPLIMSPGVSASACDFFEIKIQGKGCHGSTPELGVDPITVAAHMVLALQEINAREISMYDTAALTLGTLQAGNANNIIPDTALLKGSLRTVDEELRANVKTRIHDIATSIAKVYRAEAEVIFGSGCPSLLNDKDVSDSVAKYAKELFTPRGAFTTAELAAMSGGGAKGAGGSEDFAFVTREIPGLMLAIAAGQPQAGYTFPGHHPKVRFDEATLVKGAGLFAYAAMRWLEEHK
ncbi:MAG: amidohydrolase, partial [Peptococcaceae bacterium]|nr:amidohydrolase [Peptococcaceae bacterium]